jgi:hypothetical protein
LLARFDHAVIAVREIKSAIATFRRLGFDVRRGGVHPGRGTSNAIIRFGLDYIELLSVVDQAAGEAAGPRIRVLIDHLKLREGFAGYGFASDDVGADVARIRAAGLNVEVVRLSRTRPDGTTLAWSLAFPEGMPWFKPWPFLIQWDDPDDVRLRLEPPGHHPNGAARAAALSVSAGDATTASRLLADQIGLRATGRDFTAGGFTVRSVPGARDPSVSELHIAVRNLATARNVLPRESIIEATERAVRIDPASSAGAQLVLVSL